MQLICRLFRQNPDSREGIITATSGLGILVNILVAAVKVIIGLMASSIAIVSEGANNATDALSSVLTLAGTKLAGKHPDEKHPFGYGRIEYLTGLIISVLILVTGIEMLINSIKLIFNPEELNVSVISIVIVAVSAVIKLLLGTYTVKMGKKADSPALEAVGVDCRNDSFVSLVTIVSALVFILFSFSIDAYAGIITSVLIIKAGLEILRDTVGEIIGRPGEEELAAELYREIRSTEGVLAAADMMLHNYGPDRWSGSVNIEMDHDMTVGEIYRIIHALQLKIMHEKGVTMVFGVYAVDNDHEESKLLRQRIADFVREQGNVKSFHAVYIEPETEAIYCDLTVDYTLKNWEALEEEFTEYMKRFYPENELRLTIETDFV